jgi:hypothetical protein
LIGHLDNLLKEKSHATPSHFHSFVIADIVSAHYDWFFVIGLWWRSFTYAGSGPTDCAC